MGEADFHFAHLADAHLGAWPRNPPLRDLLRRGVLQAIEAATEHDARFLLISGDLFHSPVPDPGEAAPVAAALRRFQASGRAVYAIYGSHDYVAHRTSWLDVLAESGVFVRVAPEAVREGRGRWELPYVVDAPTGVRIAGISGRSHGLDRDYYESMDASRFLDGTAYRVFQFHAGVEEYFPPHLRGKMQGIRRDDLPAGCEYYAGGHIHYTYEGKGPGGGVLVNPGAVFGTNRSDVEQAEAGRTHRGLALVSVRRGVTHVRMHDTTKRGAVRTLDLDVSGQTSESIPALLEERLRSAELAPGTVVLERLHGTLAGGPGRSLDLAGVRAALEREGVTLQTDLRDIDAVADPNAPEVSEATVEAEEIARLLGSGLGRPAWLEEGEALALVNDLLAELGTPKAEGESQVDYLSARRTGVRRLLRVPAERIGSDPA